MKVIKRSLAAAVALVVIVVLVSYVTLRRSLPQLDGIANGLPLAATVTVERDATGMPTIVAENRADLAFGTGYVHAQDRFFQMDLMRRQAAGELAALAGPAALALDKRNRLHRLRGRARDSIANVTALELAVIDAYTAGVNAGLQSLASKPFEYFLLQADPWPWVTEDSILVAFAMFMELNDERATRDVQRGLVHDVVPQMVFDWLYPQGTEWDAPMQGAARTNPPMPDSSQYDLRERHVLARHAAPESAEEVILGSNNWAVSGQLTSSGRAIVANDMHLGLRVPNTFYRARLVVRGNDRRDITGVSLPGTPVIITGSNGKVAWAFTNSYGDWSDAVILQPGSNPGTYLTPTGEQHYSEFREVIEVKGQDAEELVVRETIWGPVLDDNDYPGAEIAVSWIAHRTGAVNLGHIDLETAASVAQAMQIANRLGIPPQNFVSGDADGNIGWTIAGKIPRRSEYDSFLPADWSKGNAWQGWLSPAEYPRMLNPPGGLIWTANARVVDGEDLQKVRDGGYDLGARARQVRDGLRAIDTFDVESMLSIQTDDRALFLERWQALAVSVLSDDAVQGHDGRQEYRRLVADWTASATAASTGYRLVRAFRNGVRSRVFTMLTDPVREVHGEERELRISNQFEGTLWSLLQEQPDHLLSADYDDWSELLLDVIDENLEYFADNFSGPLAERTWGERNSAAIRHPLSPAVPLLARWLDMPVVPLDGDSNMPRAQGPDFGASERFAVSPGAEADGYLHMPTGQSGHPLSRYFRQGHDDWVNGRSTPFLPGVAVHSLTLAPE